LLRIMRVSPVSGVEQHGGLVDAAAVLEGVDLPLHLVIDRLLQEAEGVEVLDLAPGAELRGALLAHRDVGVAAERALLHVAVADVDPAHQRVQRAGVGHRLGGRAHVGLGDDLEQRCAGAVEVDAGHAVEVLVQALAGVFLEVGAGQAHRLLIGGLALADADRDRAADHDRQVHLADLVALGEVGVEVVLAREHALLGDVGADRQAEADRALDRAAVEHRQHAGQGDVHRARLAVGLGAEGGAGAGEDLAGGVELGVDFQPDDDFPIGSAHGVFSCRVRPAAQWHWPLVRSMRIGHR
jgi:hypothetical protein